MPIDLETDGPVPFLKWPGGKRWFASHHISMWPDKFRTYFEPFLGSAAIFFHLKPRCAVLTDANGDLIETYRAIRSEPRRVLAALEEHSARHCKEYYYKERARRHRVAHARAAQFIYLNRTCWNGLYRVNLQGRFNVPIGTKTSVLMPTDNFPSIAACLRDAAVAKSDFEPVIDLARLDDFIFADPPYTVRHNSNGFLKYNHQIFSWADQIRLAGALRRAARRGVKILITNADHDSIRDLYSDFGIVTVVPRKSVLAANSKFRGKTTELVITANFLPGVQ